MNDSRRVLRRVLLPLAPVVGIAHATTAADAAPPIVATGTAQRAAPKPVPTTAPAPAPSGSASGGLTLSPSLGPQGLPRPKMEAPVTDVLAITSFVMSAPIAVSGENVRVTATVKNLGKVPLQNVEWRFVAGTESKTGVIASILPGATADVVNDVSARAVGTLDLQVSIDPGAKREKLLKDRLNNEARSKLVVLTGDAGQWRGWARKAAAKVNTLLDRSKREACVEGVIAATSLTIKRIVPGNVDTGALTATLTGEGIPEPVARAFVEAFWRAYKTWAEEFRGEHPGAFPAFAAWPGAYAPPMPSTPATIGLLGGSPVGTKALTPPELESTMRAQLGARANEPGAADALKDLAQSMSAQLTTWVATQPMLVLGKGPVPMFAPPYVPVGPVVAGDLVRRSPQCGDLP